MVKNCKYMTLIGRILNCLGLKQYKFDSEHTEERISHGKELIDSHRKESTSLGSYHSNR